MKLHLGKEKPLVETFPSTPPPPVQAPPAPEVWIAILVMDNGTQRRATEFSSKSEAEAFARKALSEPVAVETAAGQTHFYPSSRVDSVTVEKKAVTP